MLVPYLNFKDCRGVNNTEDMVRLSTQKGYWLTIGQNVDIDDTRMVHRRKGFQPVISGNIQAIWSNWPKGTMFLYIQDGNLKRMFEDYSTETILSNFGLQAPYSFAEHNDIVYFSSLNMVGFIEEGKAYPFPAITETFKTKMVGGHLLEVWANRLFAAQSNKVFFSDSMALTVMDKRRNYMQFNGNINMMLGIAGGMYVCSGPYVYWLSGNDVSEFVLTVVNDTGVIPGSAIKVEGEEIGDGLTGTVVLWAASDGINLGLPGGQVKNVTKGNYVIEDIEKAAAIYRDDLGFGQYLMFGEFKEGEGGGVFGMELPMTGVQFSGDIV